jgi:hypothetical protein
MDKGADILHPPLERAPRPRIPSNLDSLNAGQINKLTEACWAYYNNFFQYLPNPKIPEGSIKKKQSADLEGFFPGDSSKPLQETFMKTEPALDKFSKKRLVTSDQEFFRDIEVTIRKLEQEGKVSVAEIAKINEGASADAKKYILVNKMAQPIWDELLKQGYSEHDLAA